MVITLTGDDFLLLFIVVVPTAIGEVVSDLDDGDNVGFENLQGENISSN